MESINKTKIEVNKVKTRFLPLPEAVALGLEAESKFSDFTSLKLLGEGSFGKVYLVKHNKTGATYAIKSIDKRNKTNQDGKLYFRREIEIMYKVHHPNVVKLYSHFEDDDFCYFVMENISKGNLYSILSKQKSKCFEVKTVAQFMRDLISSVYYLHNMDPAIVHRDIKPENVLLAEDGRLKLTDFGWSNYINENETRVTYCGTPVYLAPEMIKEIGHGSHLDIWCIGVLMFELLTGGIPFPGSNMNVLSDNILKTKISWPKDINMDAKNLISKILKPDPKDRISLVDMLKHPFFTKALTNPTEFLFTPLELADLEETKPFLLSKDLPTGFNLKSLKEKKAEKVVPFNKESNNNNYNNNIVGNPLNLQKLPNVNTPTLTPTTNSNTSGVIQITNTNAYSDLTPNIKGLYDKLKLDYEALTNSYNEIVVSKSEVTKKIEDFSFKETYLKQQKEVLIKELDEKDNEKLAMQNVIAELNGKLQERDNKLKNMTNLLSLLRDKCKKDEDEVEKCNKFIDQLCLHKDEEVKGYKDKIEELQRNLIKDDNLENQITNIRQSISGMSDRINTSEVGSNNNEYRVKMENEFRVTKESLTKELENFKKNVSKEREKYLILLKNKDDEIKKIVDEKSMVKDNEAKKYEKLINKYENYLKEKEIEVEGLKSKVKKLDNIISIHNLKK